MTDLRLPGIGGLGRADRLRAGQPGLKVLYTSGALGEELAGPSSPSRSVRCVASQSQALARPDAMAIRL